MTALDEARLYSAMGWRVFPLPHGSKVPKLQRWQERATTDDGKLMQWFATTDRGVAIATGRESGLWVLDVDVAGDKAGDETLAELCATHGDLPPTRTSITGSGGVHYLFAWPTDGREPRNSAGTRLGPGLDVRGEGGFIVAPPSVHPNGRTYEWDAGEPDEVAEAPEWLLALVCPPDPEPVRAVENAEQRSDRPGDQWAASVTWPDLLEPDGWTLGHVDRRTNEHHWVRPGKDARDGTSATTGYTENDNLKVFTSSMQHVGLMPEQSYSKLGYIATVHHGGDLGAAAAWCREQGFGDERPELADLFERTTIVDEATDPELVDGWEFVDLSEILDGSYDPPTPTIGLRNDGAGLIYPGRVHSIAGEPGGGKTWLALHIITEQILAGGRGALIDYEDTPSACVHRLKLLGLTRSQIRDSFTYIRPDGPLKTKSGKVDVRSLSKLEGLDVDVVVIDSVGESLAVEGMAPNDDDAVTQWFRLLPRMLARRGAAVIGLDHVTKSKDERGLWAIGSQRKLAAIDGAAYGVDVSVAPTKTKDGRLKITAAKDRHGTYQRGHLVAQVAVNNVDTGVAVIITAPETRFRPTVIMERVSRMLEEVPTASGRGIEQTVKGKAEHIRAALDVLVDEKFVACEVTGRGNQYSSLTAFRETDDAVASLLSAPRPSASPLVPDEKDALHDDPLSECVPLVPDPLRSRGREGTHSRDRGDDQTMTTDLDLVPEVGAPIDDDILENF